MRETRVGALMQAHRKIYSHICVVCLSEFTGIDTAIFCTNRCKQEDKDLRRKAKEGDQSNDQLMLIDERKLARKSKITKRYTA